MLGGSGRRACERATRVGQRRRDGARRPGLLGGRTQRGGDDAVRARKGGRIQLTCPLLQTASCFGGSGVQVESRAQTHDVQGRGTQQWVSHLQLVVLPSDYPLLGGCDDRRAVGVGQLDDRPGRGALHGSAGRQHPQHRRPKSLHSCQHDVGYRLR